jgi:hypothetical protein
MKKTIFVALSLSVLIFSACKKERTCTCTTTYSKTVSYTGNSVTSSTGTNTKDTSYSYTTEVDTKDFQAATKANISANSGCNTTSKTTAQVLYANSSTSGVATPSTSVPPGKVNVGTYTEVWSTNCSLAKK